MIGTRGVGDGHPCFIIAEIAQAHDGSLGTAHAYIDAAALAGADAVKFQTHIAKAETTRREPWRIKFSRQDTTRYEYWQRMELAEEHWVGLKAHAEEAGLVFMSSPFSPEAVELLERLDVAAWKIGGAEVFNEPLIEMAAKTNKPVLVSSGMSSWAEIDRATAIVQSHGAPVGLYQCSSFYPCPADKVGLNVITEMRQRYDFPIGLSDHSASIYSSLGAVALGAKMLEVHLVLSRDCFGPDVSSSLTTDELAQMSEGVRRIEASLDNPVDKDALAKDFAKMRTTFGKSIVYATQLASGHALTASDLAAKKPGDGVPSGRLGDFVGRRLAKDVEADQPLHESDLA